MEQLMVKASTSARMPVCHLVILEWAMAHQGPHEDHHHHLQYVIFVDLQQHCVNHYPADHNYCCFKSVLLVAQITVIWKEMLV